MKGAYRPAAFALLASPNPCRYIGAAWLLVWLGSTHDEFVGRYLTAGSYDAVGYAVATLTPGAQITASVTLCATSSVRCRRVRIDREYCVRRNLSTHALFVLAHLDYDTLVFQILG